MCASFSLSHSLSLSLSLYGGVITGSDNYKVYYVHICLYDMFREIYRLCDELHINNSDHQIISQIIRQSDHQKGKSFVQYHITITT